jgi:hypothetical protein
LLVEIFVRRQFGKSECPVEECAKSGVKSRGAKARFEDLRRFGSAGANVGPDMSFLAATHPSFRQQTHLGKVAFFNAGEGEKSFGQSMKRLQKRGVILCSETKRVKSKTKAYVSKMLYCRVDIFGAQPISLRDFANLRVGFGQFADPADDCIVARRRYPFIDAGRVADRRKVSADEQSLETSAQKSRHFAFRKNHVLSVIRR